jgi:hypothetical protein
MPLGNKLPSVGWAIRPTFARCCQAALVLDDPYAISLFVCARGAAPEDRHQPDASAGIDSRGRPAWSAAMAAQRCGPRDVTTAMTAMTHIAIQEKLDGKIVDWMEYVSDTQYRS